MLLFSYIYFYAFYFLKDIVVSFLNSQLTFREIKKSEQVFYI